MADIAFQMLNSFLPNWQNNKYFIRGFPKCEYNDLLFYRCAQLFCKFYKVSRLQVSTEIDQNLFEEYDKRIILKK